MTTMTTPIIPSASIAAAPTPADRMRADAAAIEAELAQLERDEATARQRSTEAQTAADAAREAALAAHGNVRALAGRLVQARADGTEIARKAQLFAETGPPDAAARWKAKGAEIKKEVAELEAAEVAAKKQHTALRAASDQAAAAAQHAAHGGFTPEYYAGRIVRGRTRLAALRAKIARSDGEARAVASASAAATPPPVEMRERRVGFVRFDVDGAVAALSLYTVIGLALPAPRPGYRGHVNRAAANVAPSPINSGYKAELPLNPARFWYSPVSVEDAMAQALAELERRHAGWDRLNMAGDSEA